MTFLLQDESRELSRWLAARACSICWIEKARMAAKKRVHRHGTEHVTPDPNSRGWRRVVARGCGLVYYPMEGDWDCSHGYTWGCDGCPVAQQAEADRAYNQEDFVGPPAPEYFFLS